jgi:hypothetical protein
MKSLIVYGPKGCGKTTHAEELMTRHGLLRVCELDNTLGAAARHGLLDKNPDSVLYLTCSTQENAELDGRRFGLRVMSYENAMRTVSEPDGVEFTGVNRPKFNWENLTGEYLKNLQKPHDRTLYEHQFQQQPSPTFQAFDRFAGAMARKLEKHRMEKGDGWQTASLETLQNLLAAELVKPQIDMVDVANYAMMLWGLTNIQPGYVERKVQFNPVFAAPYGGRYSKEAQQDVYKAAAEDMVRQSTVEIPVGLGLACGQELDFYGRKADIPRQAGEADEDYRLRLQEVFKTKARVWLASLQDVCGAPACPECLGKLVHEESCPRAASVDHQYDTLGAKINSSCKPTKPRCPGCGWHYAHKLNCPTLQK